MQIRAFNATCPFMIGDRVNVVGSSMVLQEDERATHTITDIACIHFLKDQTIAWAYEFDNSGHFLRCGVPKDEGEGGVG